MQTSITSGMANIADGKSFGTENFSGIGIGIGLSAIASGMQVVAESEAELNESILKLAEVNIKLLEASRGAGENIQVDLQDTAVGLQTALKNTIDAQNDYNASIGKVATDSLAAGIDAHIAVVTFGIEKIAGISIGDAVSSLFGGRSKNNFARCVSTSTGLVTRITIAVSFSFPKLFAILPRILAFFPSKSHRVSPGF